MKSILDLSDHVSGGYFIARPAKRADWMNPGLLPETILTATDCIVEFAPGPWSISWTKVSPEARQEAGARFGLDRTSLEAFTNWSTEALETGELKWPSVFLDLDVARRVKARFLSNTGGVVVFGIALSRDLVDAFLDETRKESGQGEPGVLSAIRRGEPPAQSGRLLGFDVLGWDCGSFHSYLCNGLENEFASVLGVRPNEHGFFDRLDDASRCADHCNSETTGAEPASWLPWMVLAYDG